MRKTLKALVRSRLFRAAISVALLALILTRLDLHELGETLSNVNPELLALGFFMFIVVNLVNVAKWLLIIRTQEQADDRSPVSFFHLTAIYYMGLFFNNFLPTNFGGDVIRVWKLARLTGEPHDAAGSVVLDRVSSILALLLIALVPALIKLRLLGAGLALAVVGMFLVLVAIILVFASQRATKRLARFPLFRGDPFGMRRHLREFYYSLYRFRGHPAAMLELMAISLVYQGLNVTTVYVLGLSLGIDVSPIYYFLFIPVVLAVGMIPVSLNGIGVREGAWVLLFSQVGVSSAEAFSMSVLSLLVVTTASLAGGVFYLFDRGVPAPEGETSNG